MSLQAHFKNIPNFIRIIFNDYLLRIVGCTRWSELTEGIRFIMNLAHVACAPTEFRICNGNGMLADKNRSSTNRPSVIQSSPRQ